jgi:hypothetical protein
MIKVYIASAYRTGDSALNVRRQMDVANKLINDGFNPFIPLLYHFQHMVHPRSHQEWLDIDLEWVKICDCILRIKGPSEGADKEVEVAIDSGIPVFYVKYDNDLIDSMNVDNVIDEIKDHFNEW